MQEIPRTKHKATQTAPWQKKSSCKGLSKYKNKHKDNHITDKNMEDGGSTALERSATHVIGGLNLV